MTELSTMNCWLPLLKGECEKPYFQELLSRVEAAYAQKTVFPPENEIFSAFALCPPEAVRVVILGQDPYHEQGQANGLAFSVKDGIPLPPSLRNIYKELQDDLGIVPSASGDLEHWAKQGVFLLNTVLTVEEGSANSHFGFGWQNFTDAVIASLCELPQPIAAVLWGAQAQKKAPLFASEAPRLVLQAPHPSPLSSYRGFFGSKPFSKINDFLQQNGERPILW
ncbi:MAG: uracil-DNA glycosylase [Clostridia bacterium]|nr:uracil-DNA glycosylase [Clostridia bacterium]